MFPENKYCKFNKAVFIKKNSFIQDEYSDYRLSIYTKSDLRKFKNVHNWNNGQFNFGYHSFAARSQE